ncbi:MAG TPA: formate dehydrogenase subunit gamma [Thermoanaerobaculia bacterium]|nr:formate dehydrogenase subunit gamma [Thermoanaerobaculia bacterium]
MSSISSGAHVDSAILAARGRENVLVAGEIVRHRRVSRLIHWGVALTFFISLFSGMPIWHPIFGWMAALVGGLEVARIIHPYAGVAFFIMGVVQFFHWLGDMRLTADDKGWWRPSKLLAYMRYEDDPAVEGGKYNPGQKMFFYAVTLGAVALLISGIPMWFPLQFSRMVRELSYLLHDIVFILFVIGVITHIYLGTAAEPGTFRSMTRGTVSRSWARLHHPGWFRQVSHEEARED